MRFNKSIFLGLAFCLFAGLSASAQMDATEKKKTFNIAISQEGKNIEMQCRVGCAWETLSFEVPRRGLTERIDQFGVGGNKQTASNPDELATFSFSIAKVRGEFKLIALEGMVWETLSFKLGEENSKATLSAGGVRVR